MSVLSADEHDAIQEVFNMGVGASAAALSEMIGEEVVIGVPRMTILEGAAKKESLSAGSTRIMCAIDQHFSTPHGDGTALLMFPERESLGLLAALMGEDSVGSELSELEEEALKEVGNIILNACLSSLSNMVAAELEVELPHYSRGLRGSMLGAPAGAGSAILFAIKLDLRERKIAGELGFLLAVDSIKRLAQDVLAHAS